MEARGVLLGRIKALLYGMCIQRLFTIGQKTLRFKIRQGQLER